MFRDSLALPLNSVSTITDEPRTKVHARLARQRGYVPNHGITLDERVTYLLTNLHIDNFASCRDCRSFPICPEDTSSVFQLTNLSEGKACMKCIELALG